MKCFSNSLVCELFFSINPKLINNTHKFSHKLIKTFLFTHLEGFKLSSKGLKSHTIHVIITLIS
jgi:hypothetical protein